MIRAKMSPLILSAFLVPLLLAQCGRTSSKEIKTSLLPVDSSPLVGFRILLNIGSAHDPEGKEGLCRLTLSMLAAGGTRDRTFKQITEAFYPMAAGVGLQVEKEMSVFTGQIHVDNLDPYYGLLKEMLLEPGFREEDFIRLKTNQLNFLEKTLIGNMDEQLGKDILNLMLYDGHPYGHNEAGTVESVKGLTLEDVKAFYGDHFIQGNITFGLAGGYPADFPARVVKDFSLLPEGMTPPLILPEPRRPQGLEIVLAEKSTPATAMSMGFPIDLTKASDDYFPLWIAVSHFGEHRQHLSLLFQKIREERGQNYGDYAYLDFFLQGRDKFPAPNVCRQQQFFSIWIRPLANSNRHFVLRQALLELKKLCEEGIPQDRFELTRRYLLNYTKLYAQTLNERLGWQMDSAHYGYRDFLAEVQDRLPKITREEVNAAVKKYLSFENLYIAVVTDDALEFKDALIAETPSPVSYANPDMDEDILMEDLVYQSFPLNIGAGQVRIVTAASLFKRMGIPGPDPD